MTADLKQSAYTIVDANGGQVFTTYKGHNIHAQTKHKEYNTIDLQKLKDEYPEIYSKCKVKEIHSITLEVNTVNYVRITFYILLKMFGQILFVELTKTLINGDTISI